MWKKKFTWNSSLRVTAVGYRFVRAGDLGSSSSSSSSSNLPLLLNLLLFVCSMELESDRDSSSTWIIYPRPLGTQVSLLNTSI